MDAFKEKHDDKYRNLMSFNYILDFEGKETEDLIWRVEIVFVCYY